MVRLHVILLERREDNSRGRNYNVPSVRLKQVLNEIPSDVSVLPHQEISVVGIHDVPLVHLYDVSCKSQMKHPITLLITSPSRLRVMML